MPHARSRWLRWLAAGLLIALALQADFIGLQAQDLNLVTAVLVGVALVLPKIKARLRGRNGAAAQACSNTGDAP